MQSLPVIITCIELVNTCELHISHLPGTMPSEWIHLKTMNKAYSFQNEHITNGLAGQGLSFFSATLVPLTLCFIAPIAGVISVLVHVLVTALENKNIL